MLKSGFVSEGGLFPGLDNAARLALDINQVGRWIRTFFWINLMPDRAYFALIAVLFNPVHCHTSLSSSLFIASAHSSGSV